MGFKTLAVSQHLLPATLCDQLIQALVRKTFNINQFFMFDLKVFLVLYISKPLVISFFKSIGIIHEYKVVKWNLSTLRKYGE